MDTIVTVLLFVIASCAVAATIWFIYFVVQTLNNQEVSNIMLGNIYVALLDYEEGDIGNDDDDAWGDEVKEAARWN